MFVDEMCECSLSYKKLVKAIENGECEDYEKLKNDSLNKHSVIHRVSGLTYCRGWFCEHRKKNVVKFTIEEQRPELQFNDNEKEYIKERGWDFLLDEEWVAENVFQPHPIMDKNGIEYTKKSSIPIKHPSKIEDGDIVIFHEYDEYEMVDGYETDRFYEWDSRDHSESSCPFGFVVPCKKKKGDDNDRI